MWLGESEGTLFHLTSNPRLERTASAARSANIVGRLRIAAIGSIELEYEAVPACANHRYVNQDTNHE